MRYLPEYWEDVEQSANVIPNLEKLYNKAVLVTGATGMVCSVVVELLVYLNCTRKANIRLIIAGRSRERTALRFRGAFTEDAYEFMAFDALEGGRFEAEVDYIIHGASNANPAVYSKEPVETLLGNIVGLHSMLELARSNRGSRLLYVSSSEVYGNRVDGGNVPYKEDEYGYVDVLNPRACYPNGKRTAETLCACYAQEYGVDSVIVRLGHIYGPSITRADTRATAAFTRDVLAGRDIVMKSAGTQLRSYCYTLDCASAIIAVLINGKNGEAYNISNRDSVVSIRDMAEAIARAGGVRIVFENPSDAERKSYNMMQNSALDATKLEATGWKAVFGLDKGVRKMLEFCDAEESSCCTA